MPKVQPYDRRLMAETPGFLVRGQTVLHLTERASYRLTPQGIELFEIAPGADLQRDVLGQMDFAPGVALILPLCRRSTLRPAIDVFKNHDTKAFRLSLPKWRSPSTGSGRTVIRYLSPFMKRSIVPSALSLTACDQLVDGASPKALRSCAVQSAAAKTEVGAHNRTPNKPRQACVIEMLIRYPGVGTIIFSGESSATHGVHSTNTPKGVTTMALYLTRFSYTPETWARLTKNPEDRREAARKYIESVGGKLHGFWYAFGAYDGYNLWEAPDNVSMAAVAIAIGGGGALSKFETTPLLTVEETLDALGRAQGVTYRPPGA